MEIELYQLFEQFLPVIIKLQDFMDILKCFSTKWNIKSGNFDEIQSNLQDGKTEIVNLKQKCLRHFKKCVFYGRTSTGKSALINRLIGDNILPTGFGGSSNRIVEIKSNSNKNSLFFVKDENGNINKEEITALKIIGKINIFNDFGIPIKLFLGTNKSNLTNSNFVIYDTPGLGKGSFEPEILELCRDADLLIVVVSILSELGSLEKKFLLNCRNYFSDYNVIIVYSFYDILQNGLDFDEQFKNQEKAANDFLVNELKIKENNEKKKNVFRLSALEKDQSQITDEISIERYKNRENLFYEFQERILEEMEESIYERKMSSLEKTENILNNLFIEFNKTFNEITDETSKLVEEIKSEMTAMENLAMLNTKANKEIDLAFKSIVECVVKNGKKAVDCKSEAKMLTLEKLINDTVENEISKLKDKVKDLINNTECTEYCKNVLNDIYFSKYFSYKSDISNDADEDIMKNLLNLNKGDHVKSGLKTGMNSAMSVAAVASGGITVGATAAIDAAAGIASLITGKNISISGFLKFIKKPFNFIWDREEENIKKHFVEIKENLKDSIIKLPEKIESDINQLIDPLKENFAEIEENCETIKQEILHFKEKSFIYM